MGFPKGHWTLRWRLSIDEYHIEMISFSPVYIKRENNIPEISTNIKVSEDEEQSLPGANGKTECVRIGACKLFTL